VRPSCYPYHHLIETYRSWGEDPGFAACLSGKNPGGFAFLIRLIIKVKKLEVLECIWDYDQGIRVGQEVLSEATVAGLALGQAEAMVSLSTMYAGKGEFERMRETAQAAWELYAAQGNRRGQANALGNLGLAYDSLGDSEKASACYEQAQAFFEAIGNQRGLAACLHNRAGIHMLNGEYGQALKDVGRALSLLEEIGDQNGQGYCLNTIGNIFARQGDAAQALKDLERALSLQKIVGDRYAQAVILNNLSAFEAGLGNYPKALACSQEAYVLCTAIGDPSQGAKVLRNLGMTHEGLGDFEQALDCYERALAIQRQTGERRNQAMTLALLGSACLELGDLAKAQQALAEAQAIAGESPLDNDCLCRLSQSAAAFALADEALETAGKEIESGLILADSVGSKRYRALLLSLRSRLRDNQGDWPGSQADWVESVNLLGSIGEKADLARACYFFGKALLAHGEEEKGRWYLTEARRLWEIIGAKGWLAKVKDSSWGVFAA
jgi:tetratricopeptide (TPR) repeat protein